MLVMGLVANRFMASPRGSFRLRTQCPPHPLDAFSPSGVELKTNHVREKLIDSPVGLIESALRQTDRTRVGVRYRNPAQPLAAHHPGNFFARPIRIVKIVGGS